MVASVRAFRKQIRPIEAPEPLREAFEPANEPVHPGSKLLTEFWRAREAAGGFVVGRDVPSRALAKVLQNLALFEPVVCSTGVTDLRVRLAGDGLRLRFGRDVTGEKLSELFDHEEFDMHIAQTRIALNAGSPLFLRSELRHGSPVERRLEIVILPVWNRTRTERWILAGVFYFV